MSISGFLEFFGPAGASSGVRRHQEASKRPASSLQGASKNSQGSPWTRVLGFGFRFRV